MVQSNTYFLRSYVRQQEFDLTQVISSGDGTFGFVQGEFKRGPLKPSYVTPTSYYDKYDAYPDPSLSFAADTSIFFVKASSNLLINRVVNEARHAGSDLVIDNDDTYGLRILGLSFPVGIEEGYLKTGDLPTSGASLLKFDGDLITGNVFEIVITDGSTSTAVTVPYTSSHNETMTAIAVAINSAIQAFSPSLQGTAVVYEETSSPIAKRYTTVLRKPNDASIEFLTPTITGGASQAAVVLKDSSEVWLGSIIAENPGEWAESYGWKLTGINEGTRERYRITFAGPLITGNDVTIFLNEVPTTVPFNTDNDTTLADIAAAYKASPLVRDAYVEVIAGGSNNDRSLVIVMDEPGPDKVSVDTPTITGGASQTIAVSNRILKGIDSTGIMTLQVFHSNSVNSPIETFRFSLFAQTNGRGENVYYDNVINTGAIASLNIRFIGNPDIATKADFAPIQAQMLSEDIVYKSTITWLRGGDNGLSVTTGKMITELDKFTDRIKYPVNLLLSAGYTDVAYMQALVELAEKRGDCTAILDMPTGVQAAQSSVDFRKYTLNIDSSFGAIYTPNVQIADLATGEKRYVPPSGLVGAAYVYNDAVRNRYAAPAGLNRGPLSYALGLLHEYTPGELELMNPEGINTIVNKPSTGPTIMWQDTLQVAESALRNIHIRRTMNFIKTTLADQLEFVLFDPNSESTRFKVTQLAESVLAPAYRNEGLYSYLIKCDDDNNTPEVIDLDILICDIYVKPVRVAKGILLRSFITITAVSFSEVVATTVDL